MKQVIIFALALVASHVLSAQTVYQGWYYLPQPAGNVWGIPYHQPVSGSDLSAVGGQLTIENDHDLIVLPGPKSSDRLFTKLNNLIATSLFKGNKDISYHISSFKLKQVILSGNIYENFGNGNYYVTQALAADSVIIIGRINKNISGNTSDAEKMIAAYAGGTTAAFHVVNTLTGNDTAKQTGIISYSKTSNDSFTIVITDPDVYFAVKLTKVENYDRTDDIVQRGLTGGVLKVDLDGEPTDILSLHYEIKKGLDVGIRFSVQNNIGLVEIYQQYGGKNEIIIARKTRKIDGVTKFKIDGSLITQQESLGRRKSQDYLIRLYTSFSFDPSTKSVIIEENNRGPFKTAIEHIEGTYTSWPK